MRLRNKAAIERIILSNDIRKVQITFFLFNHEYLLRILVNLHHKGNRIKDIDYDSADKDISHFIFR